MPFLLFTSVARLEEKVQAKVKSKVKIKVETFVRGFFMVYLFEILKFLWFCMLPNLDESVRTRSWNVDDADYHPKSRLTFRADLHGF
ncbi:hypothetical protein H8E88_13385 [candidate division KSB1 bacterium]|nr:hypothetical protein [candidate division KSB1 bacterium]MBL7094403.1 hypothetical protein [candidate division KSB1 bacterium]